MREQKYVLSLLGDLHRSFSRGRGGLVAFLFEHPASEPQDIGSASDADGFGDAIPLDHHHVFGVMGEHLACDFVHRLPRKGDNVVLAGDFPGSHGMVGVFFEEVVGLDDADQPAVLLDDGQDTCGLW